MRLGDQQHFITMLLKVAILTDQKGEVVYMFILFPPMKQCAKLEKGRESENVLKYLFSSTREC
jgi:hypothetical protein